jgi:NAD-dependent dihydropyrimidine dehydrogenase PreA subunit
MAGMPERNSGPRQGFATLKKHAEDAMGWTVTVDHDKCTACGECVDVCPVEVYEIQDGKSVPVHEEECLGCESCAEVCESNAITIEEN